MKTTEFIGRYASFWAATAMLGLALSEPVVLGVWDAVQLTIGLEGVAEVGGSLFVEAVPVFRAPIEHQIVLAGLRKIVTVEAGLGVVLRSCGERLWPGLGFTPGIKCGFRRNVIGYVVTQPSADNPSWGSPRIGNVNVQCNESCDWPAGNGFFLDSDSVAGPSKFGYYPGLFDFFKGGNLTPYQEPGANCHNYYERTRDKINSVQPARRIAIACALFIVGIFSTAYGFCGDDLKRLLLGLLLGYLALLGFFAFLGSWIVYG